MSMARDKMNDWQRSCLYTIRPENHKAETPQNRIRSDEQKKALETRLAVELITESRKFADDLKEVWERVDWKHGKQGKEKV